MGDGKGGLKNDNDFGSLDRAVSHVLSDLLSQTVDYRYG